MDALKILLDGANRNRTLFVLLSAFALFPIYTHVADLPFWNDVAMRIMLLGMAAMGLNLVLGYGGMVSFGHAAFVGVGAYCVGISQFYGFDNGWAHAVISLAVCGAMGLVIGFLSLRTTGIYFIMITLAFGQMFFFFAISWAEYGGEDGLSIYVRNGFPGLNTLDPIQFYGLCLGLLCLVLLFAWRLSGSPFGLALNAARQVPVRVETAGLDPVRLKLVAFVVSGAITGLAGALFADLNRFVSPTMFSWQTSGEIMIFIIIGGVGRLFGPVVGALVFVALEHWLGALSDFWHIYLGLLLLVIVLFGRGGLIGMLCGREAVHD